jgi:hypothetical protein
MKEVGVYRMEGRRVSNDAPCPTRLLARPMHIDEIQIWPCRKSDPDVLVVEPTENRPRKNPADGMNYT